MYTDFLTAVLADASTIATANFGKTGALKTKDGDANQVLTQTDLEIGELIVARVREAYPEHNVIDEEAGVIDNGSAYTWVIDPIDGTSNFASALPFYGIMIGLLRDGQPIAGGISLPEFNETYTAEAGKGAFCNGQPVHATESTELINNLVVYNIDGNHAHPEATRDEVKVMGEILVNIRNMRNTGSAYDLGMLATGRVGACLTKTAKIWDAVAPHIIAQEAGILVTTFDGAPIDYSNPVAKAGSTFTWCMAPEPLHRQLQAIIRVAS